MTANQETIHAYRHLYRSLLHAVQFARPNRFIARDQLRAAFREEGAQLNAEGVKRTVWFLQAAAKEKGLEHKILKNLLMVRSRRRPNASRHWGSVWRQAGMKASPKGPEEGALDHYDMTVAMLNKTMGLCLR